MAPRIKRVYRKRTSSIGTGKGNDLSFLSLYREEKKQQMGGNGDEEVKRMREELRERERLMMRDLNAFKAQACKPKVEVRDVRRVDDFKDTKDVKDAKDAKDIKDLYNDERILDDKVDTVDRHDSLPISIPVKLMGFNEHLLQSFLQSKHHLSSDAYSFISNSPIVTESRILDGSFALINDFPSSSPMVPGSSRIASPEGVYRTSERTSPIKDDGSGRGVEDKFVDYGMDDAAMDDEGMDEVAIDEIQVEQPKPTTRRTRKVTFNCRQRRRNRRSSKRQERVKPNRTKRQDKSFKTRRKRQTINSPPNSPLPGGHSLSIDPEFLESYPGIWMKRLPVPLTVSPSASPDHFFRRG